MYDRNDTSRLDACSILKNSHESISSSPSINHLFQTLRLAFVMVAYFSVGVYVVSFAAVFRDVTERFPERLLSGEHCVISRRTAAKETRVYANVLLF